MINLSNIIKDKTKIKELKFTGSLSSTEIVKFLIAFFENLVGVKLTDPEREFFLLTLKFLSEGRNLSDSNLIPVYKEKLNVTTNKTIYERRSGLIKKYFMNKVGNQFYVQDIFNPTNYNDLKLEISLTNDVNLNDNNNSDKIYAK